MRNIKWIYQERESTEPWALYVEREWIYRKPRDAIYTLRLYSECVLNTSYYVEMRQCSLTKTQALRWVLNELRNIYGEADPLDHAQLQHEFDNLSFAKEN